MKVTVDGAVWALTAANFAMVAGAAYAPLPLVGRAAIICLMAYNTCSLWLPYTRLLALRRRGRQQGD